MLIKFERTGGYAGMSISATINAADLPVDRAEELSRLIEKADFFNLPERIVSPAPRPDRFQYKVKVQEKGRTHTVTVSEEAMPANLGPLIKWLSASARPVRQ